MSDVTAANVAASTDAEFETQLADAIAAENAAGPSDNQDELDVQPIEDKETPVVEDPTPDPKPQDPDPAKADPDPNAPVLDKDHDINATLNEDDPEEDPNKDPKPVIADDAPRFQRDAKNLADKWETMTEGDRLAKVVNLAKNRPHTFNALAKELGTTPDLLLTQHELDATDYAKPEDLPEFDPSAIAKQAEEAAYARLKAEQANNPEQAEAQRNRFVTEVSTFAKHNKLDAETTKALTDFNGDLYKRFDSIKYDPANGQELSLKGRLKIAISGDESIQQALIKSGAIAHSKRILNGVNAALPKSGRPGTTTAKDASSVANSDDASFGKSMDAATSSGVVPLVL